jgi:hypothetical protein
LRIFHESLVVYQERKDSVNTILTGYEKSPFQPYRVIPAEPGIQFFQCLLDFRSLLKTCRDKLRGRDGLAELFRILLMTPVQAGSEESIPWEISAQARIHFLFWERKSTKRYWPRLLGVV